MDHRYEYPHRSAWSSPVSPTDPYPSPFYPHPIDDPMSLRAALSLNLDSLSVASPTHLSPITAPVTPISPAYGPHHHLQSYHPHFDDHLPFDRRLATTPTRPPSSSTATPAQSAPSPVALSLPRKRSFSATPAALLDDTSPLYDDTPMDLAYDDLAPYVPSQNGSCSASHPSGVPGPPAPAPARSAGTSTGGGGGSPVEGSVSGGEDGVLLGSTLGVPGGPTLNILGKPLATNNFVTKLYQSVLSSSSSSAVVLTPFPSSG